MSGSALPDLLRGSFIALWGHAMHATSSVELGPLISWDNPLRKQSATIIDSGVPEGKQNLQACQKLQACQPVLSSRFQTACTVHGQITQNAAGVVLSNCRVLINWDRRGCWDKESVKREKLTEIGQVILLCQVSIARCFIKQFVLSMGNINMHRLIHTFVITVFCLQLGYSDYISMKHQHLWPMISYWPIKPHYCCTNTRTAWWIIIMRRDRNYKLYAQNMIWFDHKTQYTHILSLINKDASQSNNHLETID